MDNISDYFSLDVRSSSDSSMGSATGNEPSTGAPEATELYIRATLAEVNAAGKKAQ